MKVLFFDRGGLAIFYKRLERGRFVLPEPNVSFAPLRLSSAEFNMILAGLDPAQLTPQELWQPESSG